MSLAGRFAANGFNISSGLGSQVKKLLLSSTKTMPGEAADTLSSIVGTQCMRKQCSYM